MTSQRTGRIGGASGSGGRLVRFGIAVVALVLTVVPWLAPAEADDTVGLVNPQTGEWLIKNGTFIDRFYFGNPGDFPVYGDWNCDGIDTPGMYRQSDGYVYLRNSNTQGIADIRFFFGNPSDVPLAGDFNGNGCDTLSIYRPSEQRFYVINELGQNDGGLGAADFSFIFGNPGDKPFVGDFDADGIDEVGLHRESTGFVYYRNSLTTGVADNIFFFGDPGDRLVAGDWIQNGQDSPALFRPYPGGDWQSPGKFYFRYTNTQGNADLEFCATFMWPEGLPVAGDAGKDGPAGNFRDCPWQPGVPTTTTTTTAPLPTTPPPTIPPPTIPPPTIPPPSTVSIDITYNDFLGTWSGSAGSEFVSLSYNDFLGTLSGSIGSEFVSLSYNDFLGTWSGSIGSVTVNLSYNDFLGTLSGSIGTATVNLSYNDFLGTWTGSGPVEAAVMPSIVQVS